MNKIASSLSEINFNSEGLAEVVVDGKAICLARVGEKIIACAAVCPHAGGRLVDGYLDSGGNIVCPLHAYKFDLMTGRSIIPEDYRLKIYPLEVKEDGVFVEL